MATILPFFSHARASASSGAIKKSSILTAPPVASLRRLASRIDTPRSPFKTSDRWPSEQPESAASLDWLISVCPSIQTASGCFVSMTMTLLLAKCLCQALLCWGEMDTHSPVTDALLMAKKVPSKAEDPPLYVGPWIRRCKSTPAEVSREAPINEGYLSGIISGKKKNPSRAKLALIAKFLDIPLSAFDRPPPPEALLEQIEDYDPELIARLSRKRNTASQ